MAWYPCISHHLKGSERTLIMIRSVSFAYLFCSRPEVLAFKAWDLQRFVFNKQWQITYSPFSLLCPSILQAFIGAQTLKQALRQPHRKQTWPCGNLSPDRVTSNADIALVHNSQMAKGRGKKKAGNASLKVSPSTSDKIIRIDNTNKIHNWLLGKKGYFGD